MTMTKGLPLPAPFPGPAPTPTVHNATPIERALGLAREYARCEPGAQAIELRNTIYGLVGYPEGGRIVLPQAVRAAMGEG
jgi:hypothetical protein